MRPMLFLLFLALGACKSEAERQQDEAVARLTAEVAKRAARDDSLQKAYTAPAPIKRPCSGARPYKNWSNAEVSTALVRYMGTDNPALIDLIEESGCRQP